MALPDLHELIADLSEELVAKEGDAMTEDAETIKFAGTDNRQKNQWALEHSSWISSNSDQQWP